MTTHKNFIGLKIPTDIFDFYQKVTLSMFLSGFALIISFVGSVILTRSIGVEGRGILSWIMSLAMIFAPLIRFGMEDVIKRIVSENSSQAGPLLTFSIITSLLAWIIISPFLYYYGITSEVGSTNKSIVVIGIAMIPFLSMSKCLESLSLAVKHRKGFNVSVIMQKSINTLFIIILLLIGLVNPINAMIALFISFLFQTLVIFFLLKKYIKLSILAIKENIYHIKYYIAYSYFSKILISISYSVIPILLIQFHSVRSAGIYASSIILINVIQNMFEILAAYVLPKLFTIENHEDRKKFQNNTIYVTLISSFITTVIFYFMSKWLVITIFGNDFSDSINVFKLLLMSIVFFAIFDIFYQILLSRSNGWVITLPPLIMAIFTILFCYVLVGEYGALGGAYAKVISGILALITVILILSFKKLPQISFNRN